MFKNIKIEPHIAYNLLSFGEENCKTNLSWKGTTISSFFSGSIMKMINSDNFKKAFTLSILLFSSIILSAQIYTTEIPPGNNKSIYSDTLFIDSNAKIKSISKNSKLPEAMLFGETIEITSENIKNGKWIYLGNEEYVWRLVVKSENATALNAYFSNVNIEKNDQLFVYSPKFRNKIIKIDADHKSSRFGTSLFYDNVIVIEFVTDMVKELPFNLREIGISTVGSISSRDFGDAASCEISVNCPEGEPYNLYKKSVGRILVKQGSSLFWCTGSLINNTKKDGTPYFLTANHCGKTSSMADYSDWVFDFNFESPDCDMPVFEPEKNTIYGSELLAYVPDDVNSFSDFKLLLLSQNIPSDFQPYFIGWDRSGSQSSKGVSIHHPQGDIKMISYYLQPLTSTEYYSNSENPDGKYWRVNWSETESGHGVTEGGSSGSPIYNEQGLLIGTLTGGDASCTYQDDPDWYGKFSYHWESNGDDSTTQLKYWLDPLNYGVEQLNGTNLDSSTVIADFSASTTNVTIGGAIEFRNLSVGNITDYKWYFEGGKPLTSDLQNPEPIAYHYAGTYDVKLVVESANGSDSITVTDYIKVESMIYPSITSGPLNIKVGDIAPDKVIARVYSPTRQLVLEITEPVINESGVLSLDLSPFSSGPYIIILSLDGFEQGYKVVLVK